MIKNIRKIIATLSIATMFSAMMSSNLNFTLTKVYAEEKPSLKNLYLSQGDDIKYSKGLQSYVVDVYKDIEFTYVKAMPEDPLDTVEVNGQVANNDNNYKQIVKLEKGKNKIEIDVIDDKTQVKNTYVVYVYRGGAKAVFLDNISIDDRSFGFDKCVDSYDLELDEQPDIVNLQLTPEEGKYSISVNGTELINKTSIKLKFKSIGLYVVTVSLKDMDTNRIGTYTLNIYYGIPVTPNVSDAISNVVKSNQWYIEYGRWKYNNVLGESLKDTWFYDTKYKSYYHFSSKGNMQTGWLKDEGKTYYLNPDGSMHIGWLQDDEEWYYFTTDGSMKTGWIKDEDKWYYLDKGGTMAKGWKTIGGNWYYLNSNGAMRTGWIYYGKKWYFLNEDGTMSSGWIKNNNEWYYLNSDGSMKSGEWFYYNDNCYYFNFVGSMRTGLLNKDDKYYYFNQDGTLLTSSKIIDGYLYEVNTDGSLKVD
jgi:glucan-binding YG repeat protein